MVLLCALLLPELLPGEGGTAGGGQDVGVDVLSPFLCPREAERGDHGQEDLVLHPREKPTSGQQDQHRSQQTEQVCDVSGDAGLSTRAHKQTRACSGLEAARVLGVQLNRGFPLSFSLNPHRAAGSILHHLLTADWSSSSCPLESLPLMKLSLSICLYWFSTIMHSRAATLMESLLLTC